MRPVLRRDCAIDVAMSFIEGRWKAIILYELNIKGRMRFTNLMNLIDGISPRMMSKQLKELEAEGMVMRHMYTTVPPCVEYFLTPLGESVMPVLNALSEWGIEYMAQTAASRPPSEMPPARCPEPGRPVTGQTADPCDRELP